MIVKCFVTDVPLTGGSHLNGQVPEISVESSIQIVRLDNTGLKGAPTVLFFL